MKHLALVMVMVVAVVAVVQGVNPGPGPQHPPTHGQVWPKPQQEKKENRYYTFNPTLFHIEVIGEQCPLLSRAVERYRHILGMDASGGGGVGEGRRARRRRTRVKLVSTRVRSTRYQGQLHRLNINLTRPCEEYPHYDMDEAYKLSVSAISVLQSGSVWGALRGLETFAQLLYYTHDNSEPRMNATLISDFPRYRHRGVLVDSARHYLPPPLLLRMLDALAANKMNVLHWHIVDDQSFPYVSNEYPKLSEKGAFHPSLVYTAEDIAQIVEYARDRGVRVIPEFDVPGHTHALGASYPELLTPCYSEEKPTSLGPLHPLRPAVYKLLRGLLRELAARFPDRHLHIGGDEVDMPCWSSNPELRDYMEQHNLTRVEELQGVFMEQLLPLLDRSLRPIVWNEVFENVQPLDKNILVQVWKSSDPSYTKKILSAGHDVIASAGWYLDHLEDTARKLYAWDPREGIDDPALADKIVGGEACMWGEMVNEKNIMTRVWPRASAVAEILWSAGASSHVEWVPRLEEHACRMQRRGIDTEPPFGPGFCVYNAIAT